jgi:hypothetical protein
MTQTLGEYLGNITEMSLVTTPYSNEQWVEQWTMFYWAWGLSWAPFVGSFIARVSRGPNHPRVYPWRDDRAGCPQHALVLNLWWIFDLL